MPNGRGHGLQPGGAGLATALSGGATEVRLDGLGDPGVAELRLAAGVFAPDLGEVAVDIPAPAQPGVAGVIDLVGAETTLCCQLDGDFAPPVRADGGLLKLGNLLAIEPVPDDAVRVIDTDYRRIDGQCDQKVAAVAPRRWLSRRISAVLHSAGGVSWPR